MVLTTRKSQRLIKWLIKYVLDIALGLVQYVNYSQVPKFGALFQEPIGLTAAID